MAFDPGGRFNSIFGIGPEVITRNNQRMMANDAAYYQFVEERAASFGFFFFAPHILVLICLLIGDQLSLFTYSLNDLDSLSYIIFDTIFRFFLFIGLIVIAGPSTEIVASGNELYRLVAMFGFTVLAEVVFLSLFAFWILRSLVGVSCMIQYCRENSVSRWPRSECRKYWINSILGMLVIFYQVFSARIFVISVNDVGFLSNLEVASVTSVFFYVSLKAVIPVFLLLLVSVLLGAIRANNVIRSRSC